MSLERVRMTLRLPPDADGSSISTKNQNGKVVVTLPKLKGARQTGVALQPRSVI